MFCSAVLLTDLSPQSSYLSPDFWRHGLLADDLNEHALPAAPVKLSVEDLLPRTEIQPSIGNGHKHFSTHDLPLEVRIPVVFPGLMVAIVLSLWGQRIEKLVEISDQTGFIIVDIHTGRDMHRIDQHEPLLHPTFPDRRFNLARDVHVGSPGLGFKEQLFAIGFHGMARTRSARILHPGRSEMQGHSTAATAQGLGMVQSVRLSYNGHIPCEGAIVPSPSRARPRLSTNARTILERRYLIKNAAGRPIETPAQMFWRVARNVAQAERRYRKAAGRRAGRRRPTTESAVAEASYGLMSRLEFLPNSPTLMNAGRDLQQLSACFVLPVEDSLDKIFGAVRSQALIHQSGGGTGFAFSHLRPKNDRVASTSGVASGPVSFMRIFNMATEVIRQGGTRRGANMGILRVDHPDILEFISVKQDLSELTNFNLSVGITDAFMRAVQRGKEYPVIHPRSGRTVSKMKAQDVFDRIVEAAWATGDPGVIFLDTMNRRNPTPHLGLIEATNPCGEEPLLAYESCILGSLNLAKFVVGPANAPRIDYDRLAQVIPIAVRFLDNVIDVNHYPLPEIERITKGNRKVGLGVMGFADLLITLGIPYDSEDALTVGDRVMGFVREQAYAASRLLGKERGLFPNFKGSRPASEGHKFRNATLTTIAPTGTLSILADCSAGIEPLYAVSFTRTVMGDVRLVTTHPDFVARARAAGVLSEDLLDRVRATESIQSLSDIPADLRRLFVTAHDVSPEHHVRMQAVFQKHSDSGVSKTINLPADATRQDVASAFLLAHRLGCKGITVFRTGSRNKQVFSCANAEYC